jgi:CheY-like chemotaxis protein
LLQTRHHGASTDFRAHGCLKQNNAPIDWCQNRSAAPMRAGPLAMFLMVRHLLDELDQVSEDRMQTAVRPSRSVDNTSIFVIERDEVVRSALEFILQHDNRTNAFATFEQAFANAVDCKPNVVLLGIGMVQSDGEGVLDDLATRLPGAKILLVADSAADPFALACLERGAHDVLGKPITIDSVHDKVDVLLGRSKMPNTPLRRLTAAVI